MPFNLIKSLIILLLIAITPEIYSKENKVRQSTRPSWIKEKKIIYDSVYAPGKYGGSYYLLIDNQENLEEETTYFHYAIKLLNGEGVQNMSNISIDYDPTYQELMVHEVNLIRHNVKSDKLQDNNFTVIQRESDMDRFLYDGSLTAIMNLKDTREGDIIEYSFSLRGYNPVNKGNFFKTYYFEYNEPVREIYRRIVTPKTKQLSFQYPSGKIEPGISQKDEIMEYTWDIENVGANIYDDNVPTWFNNSKRVNISSFKNWKDVVDLLLDIYTPDVAEMNRLSTLKNSAEKEGSSDSLISTIRFVQDEIRYLGFESGLNNYKPEQPSRVFELRYADCKAKSLLLCSLLKLKGIEAWPVLVNSGKINSESNDLPSPGIFNHCVVEINNNGNVIYVDPTISNQGGIPGNIYFPDYGYGLVIKEGTTSLKKLISQDQSETRVRNYFSLDSIGGSVNYKVITEYTGFYADEQRVSFKNSSTSEILKGYLKFYSINHPTIRSTADIVHNDDRNKNLFTVEEHYVIDSAWSSASENPGKQRLSFTAQVINSAANIPSSPDRKMPYNINFPSSFTETTEIKLPEEWVVTHENKIIQDSIFHFKYSSYHVDKTIRLEYSYKTLRDHVNSEDFRDFYTEHKKVRDNLLFQLTYTPGVKNKFSFSLIALLFFLIISGIAVYSSVRLYHDYNIQGVSSNSETIGSWLVLVAIGLAISTIKIAISLFFESNFFNQNTWEVYTFWNKDTRPVFFLIGFEFIYNTVLLAYVILLQILFYKKREILPKMIIIYYLVNLIIMVIDTFMAHNLLSEKFTDGDKNKNYLEIFQTAVFSALWITYFIKSEKVKRTFTINTLKPGSSAA